MQWRYRQRVHHLLRGSRDFGLLDRRHGARQALRRPPVGDRAHQSGDEEPAEQGHGQGNSHATRAASSLRLQHASEVLVQCGRQIVQAVPGTGGRPLRLLHHGPQRQLSSATE